MVFLPVSASLYGGHCGFAPPVNAEPARPPLRAARYTTSRTAAARTPGRFTGLPSLRPNLRHAKAVVLGSAGTPFLEALSVDRRKIALYVATAWLCVTIAP